ncbi:hypothetical protein GPECTOR_47g379 [Gonium pectorale]|uniref:protein-tyrosine sulfotransferase n=1 Tax=Gonium pectorale TaxID=33097 RepID=A0A150G8C9_GONPE|nr:hypothetical protein GPECTOR_47g379 [Gonium pectorale]|eukprot:KXZ46102.1 hypothetical protein GPECTOR_47g379 [Gonium pectorale]
MRGLRPAGQQLSPEEQQLRLEIAVVLQELNHVRPDGGSRLPEAEGHYRAVLASLDARLAERETKNPGQSALGMDPGHGPGPGPGRPAEEEQQLLLLQGSVTLRGNLAALLLDAERPEAALRELGAALRQAGTARAEELQFIPSSSSSSAGGGDADSASTFRLLCGLRFNRGKALAALGRTQEAEDAYGEAARGAVGLEPDCFAKATAAMSRLPDDLFPLVRAAVAAAEESGLTRRLLDGAASGTPVLPPPPSPLPTSGRLTDLAHQPSSGSGPPSAPPPLPLPSSSAPLPSSPPQGQAPLSLSGLAALSGEGAGGGVGPSAGGWLAGIGAAELSWLHFALAKALDQRGADADEAWRVLVQARVGGVRGLGATGRANDLQSARQPYDPALDWRQLGTIVGVFTRQLLAAVEAAGGGDPRDDSAIFVVGLPRSGSTLVETILASHPEVWGAGEDTALAPLTPEINEMLTTQVWRWGRGHRERHGYSPAYSTL